MTVNVQLETKCGTQACEATYAFSLNELLNPQPLNHRNRMQHRALKVSTPEAFAGVTAVAEGGAAKSHVSSAVRAH
jgi:hypothetical protein